jgi:UDPglucose--hexose-1-phosphate uridylyltransferase
MPELRWNPLLRTWTLVAANRQQRPNRQAGECPFCPGSGKVPDTYDVLLYPNDFPALSTSPDVPSLASAPYQTAEAYGVCEVLLYSPDHTASLWQLPIPHIRKLVDLWIARAEVHAQDPRIRYIYPFENRGEAVGVTMHHPHGQLYAYSWVPLKLQTELAACQAHHTETGECLLCVMTANELADGRRIVAQNENFVAYIPHFSDYPYGVFVLPRRHLPRLPDLTEAERTDLAHILKLITTAFDALWGKPFPYMMVTHQAPVNGPEYEGCEDYFHYHIEFYPPFRAPDTIKYYASSEMGAWAAANTRLVEECAAELRALIA